MGFAKVDFSQYAPKPRRLRFSISGFTLTADLIFEAKSPTSLRGSFQAKKGLAMKLIKSPESNETVEISADGTRTVKRDFGGRITGVREYTWSDDEVFAIAEAPWVLEHIYVEMTAKGVRTDAVEMKFHSGKQVRSAIVFRGPKDGTLVLRFNPEGTSFDPTPKQYDTMVAFTGGKIKSISITVPLAGELKFAVADDVSVSH